MKFRPVLIIHQYFTFPWNRILRKIWHTDTLEQLKVIYVIKVSINQAALSLFLWKLVRNVKSEQR